MWACSAGRRSARRPASHSAGPGGARGGGWWPRHGSVLPAGWRLLPGWPVGSPDWPVGFPGWLGVFPGVRHGFRRWRPGGRGSAHAARRPSSREATLSSSGCCMGCYPCGGVPGPLPGQCSRVRGLVWGSVRLAWWAASENESFGSGSLCRIRFNSFQLRTHFLSPRAQRRVSALRIGFFASLRMTGAHDSYITVVLPETEHCRQ